MQIFLPLSYLKDRPLTVDAISFFFSVSPVLCMFDELRVPKDRSRSHAKPPATTARSPIKPKQDLNPAAKKSVPLAQTHENTVTLGKCNKYSNDTRIPTTETCLSRSKATPVVKDKAQNPKPQAPM